MMSHAIWIDHYTPTPAAVFLPDPAQALISPSTPVYVSIMRSYGTPSTAGGTPYQSSRAMRTFAGAVEGSLARSFSSCLS